jgi:hypothetical protein
MKAYSKYSEQKFKKVIKGYTHKKKYGYIFAIAWLILGILRVVDVRLLGRGWGYSFLTFGPYLILAILYFDNTRTAAFYRKCYSDFSHHGLEQRKNRYIFYRKISTVFGLLGMIGWGIWIWKSWGIPMFSTIWLIPLIFWAPWLAYTYKIRTICFFQEYKRREN